MGAGSKPSMETFPLEGQILEQPPPGTLELKESLSGSTAFSLRSSSSCQDYAFIMRL